jgi:hypothetical protein
LRCINGFRVRGVFAIEKDGRTERTNEGRKRRREEERNEGRNEERNERTNERTNEGKNEGKKERRKERRGTYDAPVRVVSEAAGQHCDYRETERRPSESFDSLELAAPASVEVSGQIWKEMVL